LLVAEKECNKNVDYICFHLALLALEEIGKSILVTIGFTVPVTGKERDIPRKPTKEEIKKWLPFLLKEVKIIRPKVIIVLSKRTYKVSFKPIVKPHISKKIKVDYVFHYSSQVSRDKFEQKFSEKILEYQQSKNKKVDLIYV